MQKYITFIDLIRSKHPDDLDKVTVCMKLLATADAIDKSCAEKLDDHQLSESRLLLLALLNEKGALTPQEASELCGVTKATMTQQINTLFKDQLIEKQIVADDRRKYLLMLTPKGQKIITEAFTEHATWIKTVTNSLNDQEMNQLSDILAKIKHNIK